jgi:protein tyrosine phosphatase (PTP) superfamily phosphohydrolase (DUF442 family)
MLGWLSVVVLAASSPAWAASTAQEVPGTALLAPNVVEITAQLSTSGQPAVAALKTLSTQGFGADIYLAPPTVSDAVPDEAAIVRAQGLAFINIPIVFDHPTAADFEAFVAAMAQVGDRKVLVHCQINLRASSMVFLHRVIVGREAPEQAYADVAKVWSPNSTWRQFIVQTLHLHGLHFEPY